MLIVYIKLMKTLWTTMLHSEYIASYGAFALLCLHYATTLATMKI